MVLKWQHLATGAVLATILGAFFSCGSEDDKDDTTPTTTSSALTFADIDPILVANCSGSTCHDSAGTGTRYVGNEANVKTNALSIKSQINAGLMPKEGKTIPAADKTKLMTYLDQ